MLRMGAWEVAEVLVRHEADTELRDESQRSALEASYYIYMYNIYIYMDMYMWCACVYIYMHFIYIYMHCIYIYNSI